jgi:lipoprotein-anchoring transpeptidase ErfK/SrfK
VIPVQRVDGRPRSRRSAPIPPRARRRRRLLSAAASATLAIGYAAVGPAAHRETRGAAAPPGIRPVNVASLAGVVKPPPSSPVAINARAVQERLVALRYLPACGVSGTWDYRTTQAVTAFQAWEGLDRDGTVGALTRAALETAVPPQPAQPGRGRRIEVYRAKGVTLLIEGSRVLRAVHSSTGKPGFDTPAGTYSVFRKELNSWSRPYGTWLPYASYFNGGIAFHAYDDVPAYPASHGCVRIPAPDAPIVYRFAAAGTPVSVY